MASTAFRSLSRRASVITMTKMTNANITGLKLSFRSLNGFCTVAVSKQTVTETPVNTAPAAQSDPASPVTIVETEEELQDEWKSLERRVSNRKPRMNDGSVPSGRSKRNSSAWDAENV